VATAMSAQSVGQTGIDPMEIFGLIVLLAVAAVSDLPQVQLFFVAGIVAVACGLAGDVMNDFHAGHVLGTSPKAQWIGQAMGAVLGAFVAVAVMAVLVSAYGPESFGPTASFVSAQSVVATMVSDIPSVPAFAIGLAAGFVLYLLNFPAMMLGLGITYPLHVADRVSGSHGQSRLRRRVQAAPQGLSPGRPRRRRRPRAKRPSWCRPACWAANPS
ncbi:MAG: OPT/YSL family transporter, partial [Eggerthellaceae bacterium]